MNVSGNIAGAETEAESLPLPSAISQARINALQRVSEGQDIRKAKQEFYQMARENILASMRQYKILLTLNEGLSVDDAIIMFQQILGATENTFKFTHDAYGEITGQSLRNPSSIPPPNMPSHQQGGPQPQPRHNSQQPNAQRAESSMNSPTRLVPRTVPVIVPGGRFTMPPFVAPPPQPPLDVPENSGPAYVVYLGKDRSSGFFHHYQSTDDFAGANSIAPSTFPARLLKSFPTVQAAKSTYEECLRTGVLALLCLEVTKTAVYIVTKGFEPGVYTSKKNALSIGLNWRGGEVTCIESTVSQAKAIFEIWKALGHVTRLRWDRKFILDDIANSAVA